MVRASETTLFSGVGGNGPSSNPHLNDNGFVYETEATNLYAGDTSVGRITKMVAP